MMKEQINELIDRYKCRIAVNQERIKIYAHNGKAGASISVTGENQAYAAVLLDLRNIIKSIN